MELKGLINLLIPTMNNKDNNLILWPFHSPRPTNFFGFSLSGNLKNKIGFIFILKLKIKGAKAKIILM